MSAVPATTLKTSDVASASIRPLDTRHVPNVVVKTAMGRTWSSSVMSWLKLQGVSTTEAIDGPRLHVPIQDGAHVG